MIASNLGNTVLLGDSITNGYAPSLTPQGWKHVIQGVGKRSDWLLSKVKSELSQLDGADDVILLIGTNDIGSTPVPISTTIRNIGSILSLVKDRAPNARLFVMTVPPFKGWSNYASNYDTIEGRRQTLNAGIRTGATMLGYRVIPLDELLAAPGDSQTLAPEADSGDHLHPKGSYLASVIANQIPPPERPHIVPPSEPTSSGLWWKLPVAIGAAYSIFRLASNTRGKR